MKNVMIAATAALTLTATAGLAQDDFQFRLSGYELATQGGRAAVMKRLDRMVDRACEAGRTVRENQLEARCEAELMEEIVFKIDDPDLTALYQAQHGTVSINEG